MKPIDTTFSAFTFSADELIKARALAHEQRAYYQTLLSDAAEEKLAEEYDPVNPLRFAQREAYLRGQMDILNMLLNSDSAQVTRPDKYSKEQSPNPSNSKP